MTISSTLSYGGGVQTARVPGIESYGYQQPFIMATHKDSCILHTCKLCFLISRILYFEKSTLSNYNWICLSSEYNIQMINEVMYHTLNKFIQL